MKRFLTIFTLSFLLVLTGCSNANDHTNLEKAELESHFKEEGYTVVKDTYVTTERIHVFVYELKKFTDSKIVYQFSYYPDSEEEYTFSYKNLEITRENVYFVEYNKGKIKESPDKYDTKENRKIGKKLKKDYKKWLKDLGIDEKQIIDFMIYEAQK